jgi:hypothetical protein
MIKKIDGAICYKGGMAIDADGSPHAYSPKNSGLKSLDYLANAGKAGENGQPNNWYGIITDNGQKTGTPIIQGSTDPAPGFYISATSLQDHSKKTANPLRYVDSETIPYIAACPEVLKAGIQLGDLCVVVYGDGVCGAIVGDTSPHNHYGEASIAVADCLTIPSSPKNGGCDSGIVYIIFPGTSKGWPRDVKELQSEAERLFNAWKGSVDDI